MILGWLRGPSRAMGINLEPAVDFAFDGQLAHEFAATPERHRTVIQLATLMHERTHWLHFIATTSGLFHLAAWEAQLFAARRIVLSLGERLQPELLPLSHLGHRFPALTTETQLARPISAWHGLQLLQAWFLGRTPVGALRHPGKLADKLGFELLRDFLKLWLIERFPGPAVDEPGFRARYELPIEFGSVDGLTDQSHSLGSYYLTEAAARLNEFTTLQHNIELLSPKLAMDTSLLWQDDYGYARKHFYQLTGREMNERSEAILAVLLHEGLNAPLPPVAPMSVFSAPWQAIHPYCRFLQLAQVTADYTPPQKRPLRLEEFAQIRNELRNLLLEQGLTTEDRALADHAQNIFGGFASFPLPAGLYEIREGKSHPVDYMRANYLGKLAYEAFGLYRLEPALIAWPALYQAIHRPHFQELFARVRPPLLFVENEGYRPTYEDPAAHAVLLADVYISESLRAAMVRDYSGFISELRTFVQHSKNQEQATDAFRAGLETAGFPKTFSDQLMSDMFRQ